MRRPAHFSKPRTLKHKLKSFPAPVGGWIANVNLATPDARLPNGQKVNGAAVLENWFPTATGIRVRRGSQQHAVIGLDAAPVTALFTYISGSNRKLFAANESGIYDVTTPAQSSDLFLVDDDGNFYVDDDDDFLIVPGTPIEAAFTTGGDWSVVQFSTSDGAYLRLVNGVDTPLVYDGEEFLTTPAITGVTPTTLSNVWVYKNRLFFVQKDTMDAWYLEAGAIGGEATKFPLGGVFGRGGALLFGASWSLDANGLQEYCAFFSNEGEVAVYSGSNPGEADDWRLVGVYRIGKPRGPKAWIRAGGDLAVATDVGLVPLSQAVQRDYAALSPSAVSYPIEDEWNKFVRDRSARTWQCEVWPAKQMVVVALPNEPGRQDEMLVANARTGAWAKYTNWGATCVAIFGDRMFFGTKNGRIMEAEVSGADGVTPYTAVCVPLFDPLKTPASLKTGLRARGVFRSPFAINAKLALQVDYNVRLPSAPDDTTEPSGSLWGTGVWGTALWGDNVETNTYQNWRSTPGSGYALSVSTQVTSGSTVPPQVEMVQVDLTYEHGDVGS